MSFVVAEKTSNYNIGVITVHNNRYNVFYNKAKNICVIDPSTACHDNIDDVLRVLEKSLPSRYNIWVAIGIKFPRCTECVNNYSQYGFGNPYITNKTPFGDSIPHSIALVSRNGEMTDKSTQTLILVRYMLKQYKSHGCFLRAQFSPDAISYLRKTSTMGHTKNGDHSVSQKEMTGELIVTDVKESNGDHLFIIGVAESRIEHGEEEGVSVSSTRYNFHSHPKEAYVRHKVRYAWPSLTDYLGYLKLGNHTIFHCVSTMEGLYVLSFSQEWVDKLDTVRKNKKFIRKNYDIDHKVKLTPVQYIQKVNHIEFKGVPIFIVKFLPWTNAAHTIFSVSYKKEGSNCRPMG